MGIEKIVIDKKVFDINLKFYFILKYLVKANCTDKDIKKILELYSLNKSILLKSALIKNFDNSIAKYLYDFLLKIFVNELPRH